MRIDVFKKTKTTKKGKNFDIYVSKLTNKKTGEKLYVQVKFVGEAQTAFSNSKLGYPLTIEFDKANANLSTEEITTDSGETFIRHNLWITKLNNIEQYVDTSLTDFLDNSFLDNRTF